MTRLIVGSGRLTGGVLPLTAGELHYLRRVRRLRDGALIDVCDGQGARCDGVLQGADLELSSVESLPMPAGPPVELWFAPPKGDRLDWLLEKATELGAAVLRPVLCERSVRAPSADAVERWERIVQAASRQCGCAWEPIVLAPVPLNVSLADRVVEPTDLGLVLAVGGPPLRQVLPTEAPTRLRVLTGPEGGLTDGEVAAAERAGFARCGLGPTILRAETAPLTVLALLRHRFGDLG